VKDEHDVSIQLEFFPKCEEKTALFDIGISIRSRVFEFI
jgi:hypothetical protein